MNDDDFQELLGRVQAGDGAAWARWVEVFEPIIRLAVRGRALHWRTQRDTDDDVQSAFVLCVSQDWPARFTGRSFAEAVAFIRRAAYRRLLENLRRTRTGKRDRAREVGLNAASLCADAIEPPVEMVARREEDERLRAAVERQSRTPAQYQAAMRLFNGESYPAVAADLGVSANALRMAHERHMARVRKELED